MNPRSLVLFVLSLLLTVTLVIGCAEPVEPPQHEEFPPESPADVVEPEEIPEPEAMAISETAVRTEAALEAEAADAPLERELPEDHWLVGTSDVEDMLDAYIAPEVPREVIAEYGPARLERMGDDRILFLSGSHYDMGYQHGTLMKEEILEAAQLIRTVGTFAWSGDYSVSIREAWERTSPFIPERYKEEIQGVADATGLTVEEVQDFTIFPELFHCSGFAIWGNATADGTLYHGRVLDYMRDIGLDKYAVILIQQPEGYNAFVNVGYAGMLGSVTGMNDQHVAIGEMGGSDPEQWDGMPMTLLVRECLELGDTLEDVRRIMEETPRTCQFYYVISDSKADDGRGYALGVAADSNSIQFIGPNEHHPQLPRPVEDAVLLSADDRYQCLVDRVEKMFGQFTHQEALDLMARGVAMRSNMHNALFKPETLEFWVANSTVREPASNRPYRHYNLAELLAEHPEEALAAAE